MDPRPHSPTESHLPTHNSQVVLQNHGRTVKSTITIKGGTLKQVQVGEKTTYIDRVVEGNQLKTVVQVGDVVSTRIYVKI
ncbi:unnamed protein product [Mesocestoides corti]|uniref:DUF5641 domain-containing protein n=1 Tax=Mesocestoides corti TaxID=53468 RepID=A0A0R3URJ3_MESCO|nr:unnamed protein product [Mesocestoides corti]